MIIRKATINDSRRISYLINKVTERNPNEYSVNQLIAWKRYNTPSEIKKQILSRQVFCAFYGNRLIGTIALGNDYILGFNVSASIRNKGIGSLLLKHLENYAKSNGIKKLMLTSTPSALGFYEKYGYQRLNNIVLNIFDVDFPEVVMEKTL